MERRSGLPLKTRENPKGNQKGAILDTKNKKQKKKKTQKKTHTKNMSNTDQPKTWDEPRCSRRISSYCVMLGENG